jgi:hypothetical protein
MLVYHLRRSSERASLSFPCNGISTVPLPKNGHSSESTGEGEDYHGAKMERIYDSLQRITQLWKKLELTKPNTSEYDAIMDQIRVLSEEYKALIDAPKNPVKSK